MKPFNLEEAKAGKPVVTRTGQNVRIVCFDKKGQFPLLVLCPPKDSLAREEYVSSHTIDGRWLEEGSEYDLMMKTEKKEGWINIIPWFDYAKVSSSSIMNIHTTKQVALDNRDTDIRYIGDPIQIEWEE